MPFGHVKNLLLPNVYRDGITVVVSTWGGEGEMTDDDGRIKPVRNLNGTLTLHYTSESEAEEACRILFQWSVDDDRVTVETETGFQSLKLTNERTGDVMATV